MYILWVLFNFYSKKLEHYLICGKVVNLKKKIGFLIMLKKYLKINTDNLGKISFVKIKYCTYVIDDMKLRCSNFFWHTYNILFLQNYFFLIY